jgi:V/A-type H+-transporting ATPase subunit I
MAVVGMAGVSFVGPKEEIEQIALELLKMENFEPMSPEVMLEGRPLGSRFQTFRINRYDALLERLDRLWTAAGLSAPESGTAERVPSLPLPKLEAKINSFMRMMDEWGAKAAELQDEHTTWRAMLAFGDAVRETGRNLSELPPLPYGRVSIGILARDNWRRLSETSLAAPILVMPLIEEEDKITAIVFYGADYREEVHKIFSSVHMRLIPLSPEMYSQFDDADSVRYHMESVNSEIESYRDMPRRYAMENRIELEKLYNGAYTLERVYSLCRLRGELSDLTLLSGWLPQDSYAKVFEIVKRKAPQTLVIAERGDILEREGQELPTLLHNLPLVRRFQEIVNLYSLPSYSELDPTFVVAMSFCLFFGFMFGDVGHGLVLMLGTWLLERKGIMGHAIASVMKVASSCAILFGLLYGSVFGSEDIIHPLWLSPMKDVNTILPVSIGVGIACITLGICFKVQNSARKGEWGEVFFSPEGLTGLAFYWLAVAQIFMTASDSEMTLDGRIFGVVMLALFLVMIFGNGIAKYFCHGETVDEGGVVHIFSVFHAMLNFVSNTASFVRLAAFALNHAGLCMAVFMLARMVENAPGGKIYHAIVLLIGHMVVVALEGMIVFIQTLRLEYYEFFGKFYLGGGRPFAPVLWKRSDGVS